MINNNSLTIIIQFAIFRVIDVIVVVINPYHGSNRGSGSGRGRGRRGGYRRSEYHDPMHVIILNLFIINQ